MEYQNCYHFQAESTKYDCLLFDLDDTLYPYSAGLAAACGQNIKDYMVEHLCIPRSEVVELGNLLYKNYGTTMAGLRAIGYNFDYDEYHGYVHGRLPYENLKTDLILRNLLINLPIRKVIFTNADKVHAHKALKRLGLEDCFDGILCFETLNNPIIHKTNDDNVIILADSTTAKGPGIIFDIIGHFAKPNPNSLPLPKSPVICKPSEAAIQLALKIANINPETTLFFEDSVRNIQSGKRVGLHTVLVGTSQTVEGVDFSLESIHHVRRAIPQLWETSDAKKSSSEIGYSGKVAVEQSVTG